MTVELARNPGVPLISAMFSAPLTGVNARWPRVLHAIEMDVLPSAWEDGLTVEAPCGAKRLRLLSLGGRAPLVPWPVQARNLPDDYVRCRECWVATGKKRPRAKWVAE